jgi:hypothetical protein
MSNRIEIHRDDVYGEISWAWLLLELGVIVPPADMSKEDYEKYGEKKSQLYNRVSFEATNVQGDMS